MHTSQSSQQSTPFFISQWVHELNVLGTDAPVEELKEHLARVPAEQQNSRDARFLRNYIQMVEAKH